MHISYISKLVGLLAHFLCDVVTIAIVRLFVWLTGRLTRNIEVTGCTVNSHELLIIDCLR